MGSGKVIIFGRNDRKLNEKMYFIFIYYPMIHIFNLFLDLI